MGSGIAQVCAMAGYDVKVQDLKQEQLDRGLAIITKNLARQVEKGRIFSSPLIVNKFYTLEL